jgi:SAM-dependent methyltransferase
MLRIGSDEESGTDFKSLNYARGRGFIGKNILRITRWLRAVNAEKYMAPAKSHLDIGCGDGYFLRRSKCDERFGLDILLGDEVKDKLDFQDSYFDYVTMLAVIEHLAQPMAIIKEIARILKPGGKCIITTPKKSSSWILKLYARDIDQEHESYFDLARIKAITEGALQLEEYHVFCLGFNQAFCLSKPELQ